MSTCHERSTPAGKHMKIRPCVTKLIADRDTDNVKYFNWTHFKL